MPITIDADTNTYAWSAALRFAERFSLTLPRCPPAHDHPRRAGQGAEADTSCFSPLKLLEILRDCYRRVRPKRWLFPRRSAWSSVLYGRTKNGTGFDVVIDDQRRRSHPLHTTEGEGWQQRANASRQYNLVIDCNLFRDGLPPANSQL
jgi:hypothetical protein